MPTIPARLAFFFSSFFLVIFTGPAIAQGYVNFEGPQTRPIAISTDGTRLYAVNTPDNRLSVYTLADPARPVLLREIPVGLEPISVTVHTKDEVWVVNHVSDSISVVDVNLGAVTDTIQVGDEPADVVFAGSPLRAFVSVATDRQVRVIDLTSHKQVGVVHVFGDDPRALLASGDGKTVWVAITRSGNRSTIVPHKIAPLPPKPTNTALPVAPAQGIIVDSEEAAWKTKLNVKLPDYDVVEIDTATLTVRKNYTAVGTILFNLTLRPGTNELWVANTEANNKVRFEPNVRGHVIDSRLTRITMAATPIVTPIDLNPGIDYKTLPNNNALSNALSQPTDIVFDAAGKKGYVAAFGTDRIGVIDAQGKVSARIEVGNTAGTKTAPRQKRGPRGLAHHPSKAWLYVLNRLSNSITVVDTANAKVVTEIGMFDPTPRVVREARGFLYDAKLSGNGTMACASCHVDGVRDNLAWDLGDPAGKMMTVSSRSLHPMKGPMMTQTLRGLKGGQAFHWRGDRANLQAFNPAFASLLGKQPLGQTDINDFVAFLESITFAANPNRKRDDTLATSPTGASAADGLKIFNSSFNCLGSGDQGSVKCIFCHTLSTGGGSTALFNGMVGQPMRAVQLRGLHKRSGRKPRSQGRTAGFGLGSDGSNDDVSSILASSRFLGLRTAEIAALERFLLAFDTGIAPAVGFSRTTTSMNFAATAVTADLNLLIAQADKGKCDLAVKGYLDGRHVGFVYNTATKKFDRDRNALAAMTLTQIGAALNQKGSVLTFLGLPLGSGKRIGVDRDGNGVLDGDDGLRRYGVASPACATVIQVDTNSSPAVGNSSFAIVVHGAPANSFGWLLLGPKSASGAVADLNLLVNLNGGALLGIRADGRGSLALVLPVPSNSRFIGAKAYCQAAMSASCGVLGIAASRGLEVTVVK